VRVSPVVTQLVFEHALRIPMKAETSSSPRTAPVVTPDTRSEVTMPDNVSIAGDDVVADLAAGRERTVGSRLRHRVSRASRKTFRPHLIVCSLTCSPCALTFYHVPAKGKSPSFIIFYLFCASEMRSCSRNNNRCIGTTVIYENVILSIQKEGNISDYISS
jgi:hypothetical protein